MLNSSIVNILAIDPGKTIGYAYGQLNKTENTLTIIEVSQQKTEDWNPYDTEPCLWLSSGDVSICRIEDFVGNGVRTVESNHTLKMIGGFRMLADDLDVEFKQCAPGTRMKYVKKGAEAYELAMGVALPIHAKDAFAHLLRECADLGCPQVQIIKA